MQNLTNNWPSCRTLLPREASREASPAGGVAGWTRNVCGGSAARKQPVGNLKIRFSEAESCSDPRVVGTGDTFSTCGQGAEGSCRFSKADVAQKSVQVLCRLLNQFASLLCSGRSVCSHPRSPRQLLVLDIAVGSWWSTAGKMPTTPKTPASHWVMNCLSVLEGKWGGGRFRELPV